MYHRYCNLQCKIVLAYWSHLSRSSLGRIRVNIMQKTRLNTIVCHTNSLAGHYRHTLECIEKCNESWNGANVTTYALPWVNSNIVSKHTNISQPLRYLNWNIATVVWHSISYSPDARLPTLHRAHKINNTIYYILRKSLH